MSSLRCSVDAVVKSGRGLNFCVFDSFGLAIRSGKAHIVIVEVIVESPTRTTPVALLLVIPIQQGFGQVRDIDFLPQQSDEAAKGDRAILLAAHVEKAAEAQRA